MLAREHVAGIAMAVTIADPDLEGLLAELQGATGRDPLAPLRNNLRRELEPVRLAAEKRRRIEDIRAHAAQEATLRDVTDDDIIGDDRFGLPA